jgi:hypothetical protein
MQTVLKNDDLQLVIGVAMVSNETDSQGDVIDERELTKAAMKALGAKVKIDHQGNSVGRVVQSLALTQDVAKALGIRLPNAGQSLWIVALKVDDAGTWARVKAGELGDGLSIGGRGLREAA